ncbi:MAG TPA: 3'(2'),5'-bisphosphate nucleotidase CysQ [Vitreimonas sp.]|nr:3'(2'),5'-bisphosphate nucleotidase CysQ [Vitreimonas sp.]
MQSAAADLSLLEAAAREAGALARDLSSKKLEVHSKGALGPVTNIDYAVDALLAKRLLDARPDYGWLSEETPDDPARRIGKARTFILDPIDGTGALVGRSPQWTISVGIVEGERAFAGAIYNPMTDEMFLGAHGVDATLNGRRARASLRETLDGARMIGQASRFAPKKWPEPWPKMEVIERQSIAYRMALVAAGMGDATLLFGFKNEWDIAAGCAIVEAAGGVVTDLYGEPIKLNQRDPRAPGVAASGAALHPLIIERTKAFPDPRKAEGR